MPRRATFIDLFAGIGGIRLGFERAGARCVFSSECDEPCRETYAANFGQKPAGDIREIALSAVPDHDILTAGFPCQPFSIIGGRGGFTDTRGTLFFEIERILAAKQPLAFLLENVRQLVTHDGGRTFATVLAHLEALGYVVHWAILNGLDFGVPQKRERVVIVGFRENVPFTFPTCGPGNAKSLAEVLEPHEKVPERYFVSEHIKRKLAAKVRHVPVTPGIWHENKGGHIGIHPFSCALRASASYNYLLVDGKRRLTPREMLRLQGFPEHFRIPVSDCQARKQAGNSVVVPKIEAIARAMLKALRESGSTSARRDTPRSRSEPIPALAV